MSHNKQWGRWRGVWFETTVSRPQPKQTHQETVRQVEEQRVWFLRWSFKQWSGYALLWRTQNKYWDSADVKTFEPLLRHWLVIWADANAQLQLYFSHVRRWISVYLFFKNLFVSILWLHKRVVLNRGGQHLKPPGRPVFILYWWSLAWISFQLISNNWISQNVVVFL